MMLVMQTMTQTRPTDPRARCRGVTLMEMLVIIGIIAILMMLIVPTLGPALERARQAACSNHLTQCYKVVMQYAADNAGRLPPANADNPATFHLGENEIITAYMTRQGLPPLIWYCPSLMRQDPVNRGPANWMNPNTSQATFNEFRIGYAYNGAPEGAVQKYKTAYPQSSADLNESMVLLADICSAPRPSPQEGRNVKFWLSFPHAGPARPQVCKVCTGGGGVMNKPPESLYLTYSYYAPVELYW